jgi:CMP-N-acetylneuraminic acid synthetase
VSEPRRLAIVPARGGSRRFPRKNLAELHGRPLLAWTLEPALESGLFDCVWVSSEDDEVLAAAERFGGRPLRRPPELAGDLVSAGEAVVGELRRLREQGVEADAVFLLLPTSPFRTPERLREAWDAYRASGAEMLISVVPFEYPPQWALVERDGRLAPLDPERYDVERGDLQPTFRHDGAYSIRDVPSLLAQGRYLAEHVARFEVDPEESVDVDEPLDLAWAEFLLERRR